MRAKVEGLALFRRFGICTSGGRRCALSNHGHSFLLVPTPTLPCLCASQTLLLPSRPTPKPARTETARLFAAVKYPALATDLPQVPTLAELSSSWGKRPRTVAASSVRSRVVHQRFLLLLVLLL